MCVETCLSPVHTLKSACVVENAQDHYLKKNVWVEGLKNTFVHVNWALQILHK